MIVTKKGTWKLAGFEFLEKTNDHLVSYMPFYTKLFNTHVNVFLGSISVSVILNKEEKLEINSNVGKERNVIERRKGVKGNNGGMKKKIGFSCELTSCLHSVARMT